MGVSFSDADLKALLANPTSAMRELDRIECEESLLFFVHKFWHVLEPGRELVDGWPLEVVCAHLEAVTNGDIQKILMNVPPGFMKSLLTEVFWPAWEWGPRGMANMRFVSFSYSSQLTERDNRRFKTLITSPEYRELWGDAFSLDKEGEQLVANDKSGWKLATSIGGVGTGERGDRVVLDDPHNVKEAESDTVRTSTVTWFNESMSNRLNDMSRSAVVVIMQRVHEADVSGEIISKLGDEYEHLMIPMEYDGRRYTTVIGWTDPRTIDGELAWPDRFSPQVVSRLKRTLGTYAYPAQYQQIPVPRGGGVFRHEWWQDWGNPDDWHDPLFKTFPAFDYIVASLDGAFTEKDENDYSALTVWGVFYDDGRLLEDTSVLTIPEHPLGKELGIKGSTRIQQRSLRASPKIMLVAAWQARLTLNELVEKVAETCKKKRVDRLLIEAKGPGISVGQEMRRLHAGENYAVQLIDPGRADKTARAYAVQPLFEDGMVYTPNFPPREWAEMVRNQMASFPKAAHDDLTDSATQALKHLRDIGVAMHEDEVERDYQDAVSYRGAPTRPLYPT